VEFHGNLCFSTAASLARAKVILAGDGLSLLEGLADARCPWSAEAGLYLSFSIETTAPVARWHGTWSALDALTALGDARGHVEGVYHRDEVEERRATYERRIATPGPRRARSAWWARAYVEGMVTRRPLAPGGDPLVLYAFAGSRPDPAAPSFVVGPLPGHVLRDGGPRGSGGGPLVLLEQELNESLAAGHDDADVVEALGSALAWVRSRPEPNVLRAREPLRRAGDGTSFGG
jgi:hypothetical protein